MRYYKIWLLIGLTLIVNSTFSQNSENTKSKQVYDDEDYENMQFFLGGGNQYYNHNPMVGVFSFDFGATTKWIGFSLDVKIYSCPFLDYGSNPTSGNAQPSLVGHNFNIYDFPLSVQIYPIKFRRNITPYITLGPGYSMLMETIVQDLQTGSSSNVYERTSNTGWKERFFYSQLGVGTMIRPFNGWLNGDFFSGFTIKVEYTRSFFRSPNILNGDQLLIKLGGIWLL
jgi:hypothetical protein